MISKKEVQSKPFFGGVPTDPDVRNIRQQYCDHELSEGMVIPYQDIERLIGCGKKSSRFRTVTSRWRKLVEDESGIVIGTQKGEGFLILNNSQKLDMSGGKLRTAIRSSVRSREVSSLIDRQKISEESRKRLEHIERKSADIMAIGQVKRSRSLPSLTVAKK